MAGGRFAGGSGSIDSPYLIEDAEDLNAIRNNLGAYYKLIQDIDMKGTRFENNWTPIERFTGSLDGDNHVIRNLKIVHQGSGSIGLIGSGDVGYTKSTIISNLGLVDVDIYVFGVGTVVACGAFIGGETSTSSYPNLTLTNCFATGKIEFEAVYNRAHVIGGLVGNISPGKGGSFTSERRFRVIRNCWSSVDIKASGNLSSSYIGGIVGKFHRNSATGSENFFGNNVYLGKLTVPNLPNLGGIAGEISVNANDKDINYWDEEKSPYRSSGMDRAYFIGLTSQQAKMISSYSDLDMENTWIMFDGFHPQLRSFIKNRLDIFQEGYYTTDINMGHLIAGTTSFPVEIQLANKYVLPLGRIELDWERIEDTPELSTLELSRTLDPFVPEKPLVLDELNLEFGKTVSIYARVKTHKDLEVPGVFRVIASVDL